MGDMGKILFAGTFIILALMVIIAANKGCYDKKPNPSTQTQQ